MSKGLKLANKGWRLRPPGKAPDGLAREFTNLIGNMASQASSRKEVLEHFKSCFATASGTSCWTSSDESWAETDLDRYMTDASVNAPLFVIAFYDGCQELEAEDPDICVPDAALINGLLAEYTVPYEIRPPQLVSRDPSSTPIPLPEKPSSLDEQARALFDSSVAEAERLLAEGRYRQAVQEMLWLLETVSTAFKGLDTGDGTVKGEYFNKIVEDLRRRSKGKTLDMVGGWIAGLHGYLSSPTGGGIRHGADVKTRVTVNGNEAHLYCNLIRSYLAFVLAEHARLTERGMAEP